jgi:hypothetical protein
MKTIEEDKDYAVVLAGSQIMALREILEALHPQADSPDGPHKILQALADTKELPG